MIDKTESKLSTHHESENEKGGHDNVAYEESEQDNSEKKDEEKPVSKKPLFSVGQGPSETETGNLFLHFDELLPSFDIIWLLKRQTSLVVSLLWSPLTFV